MKEQIKAGLATMIVLPFVFAFGLSMAVLAVLVVLWKGQLREPKPVNRPGRVVEREFYQQHQAA